MASGACLAIVFGQHCILAFRIQQGDVVGGYGSTIHDNSQPWPAVDIHERCGQKAKYDYVRSI